MSEAFEISERFDTPVLFRSTTRISHSKTVVKTRNLRKFNRNISFNYDASKYVMLPSMARKRRPLVEDRVSKLADYANKFPFNQVEEGRTDLGIVTSGIAYQYAREIFPDASFLKLGLSYPLPQRIIKNFASSVERLLVIEELDPFLEDQIKSIGIEVSGKKYFPIIGELDLDSIEDGAVKAGLKKRENKSMVQKNADELLKRPPLLCAGCPHTGLFFTLSTMANRSSLPGKITKIPKLVITGDIGCYTLAAYPPLSAMDTCGCMGASIGQAIGMEKAGVSENIVAVLGDSTFMHAGITGLVDAVYNQSNITVVILDNQTTAMTGHQGHPGTGISAGGDQLTRIDIESLVKGIGVEDVRTLDAFDLKSIRKALRESINNNKLSVITIRGECPTLVKKHDKPLSLNVKLCDECGLCLLIGCPAIQKGDNRIFIESMICIGKSCSLCKQLCPRRAIG
jgi:indolepyruvate ferredoxin oxidoreductase alpha subunit